MLRIALHRATLRPAPSSSRSFVSTVLLTKAWESETVTELKKEARKRGLSPAGNKANLVTRLRQDDERKSMTPAPTVSANVPQQVRRAHTTEVPGIPSTSEPPPLPKEFPGQFFRVALPDLSQPDPELPIQIPLLPDRWGASVSRAHPSERPGIEAHVPKMVAVAGSTTHYGGGPTYSLSNSDEAFEEEPEPVPSGKQSFWRDLADDAGLPRSFKLKKVADQAFDVAPTTETSGEKSYSRTLDSDEVRGLWVLLGLVAGSWVAAGVLQPSSAYAHTAEEIAGNAVEKVEH